jgi:hypothetical protein
MFILPAEQLGVSYPRVKDMESSQLLLLLPFLDHLIQDTVQFSLKPTTCFLVGSKCASRVPAMDVRVLDTAHPEAAPILASLTGSSPMTFRQHKEPAPHLMEMKMQFWE